MNVMHEIKLTITKGSSAVGVGDFCPQTATSPRYKSEKQMFMDNLYYTLYFNPETVPMK